MPKTAYSKHFEKELDVEQFLTLAGFLKNGISNEITQEFREWIKRDIECPSCGATGAHLVLGTRLSSKRQQHFRFTGSDGQDSHSKLCDFSNNENNVAQSENLLDFGKSRSAETRLVRTLVCKGIEQNIFSQKNMRAMRQWYFDIKYKERLILKTTPQTIDRIFNIKSHPTYLEIIPFHPSHAELPTYDWKRAAIEKFSERHRDEVALIRQLDFHQGRTTADKIKQLIERYKNQEIFDVLVLKEYYEKTIQLCRFIAANYSFGDKRNSDSAVASYRWGEVPDVFLAFSSLLLFVSEWNVDSAISKFIDIVKAPEPHDQTLGNIIGLNPFHDYLSWRIIILTNNLSAPEVSYQEELAQIESLLKSEYLNWKNSKL